MKSQHRHELQTNELGKIAGQAVGFFETHGNRVLTGVCVVALVAAAWIYKSRSDQVKAAAAWLDLAGAGRSEDLKQVRERHPGTPAADWAQLQEGQERLREGVQLLFTNQESGTKELEEARKVLKGLVDARSVNAAIRERARFNLARCLEALSEGDVGDAEKMYEALLNEFPTSVYRKEAEARIAALKSDSGGEFYTWFSKYPRPKPSERRPHDLGTSDDAEEALQNLKSLLPSSEGADAEDMDLSDGPQLPGKESPADESDDQTPAESPSEEGEAGEKSTSSDDGAGERSEAEESADPASP
ncbi:MAG: tetratricopeptide repeat protein [Planctomycetales bacterium]